MSTFFTRVVNRITQYANVGAAISLVLIVLITVISATSRFVLGFPIPDAEAICEMLLVGAVLLPLAAAQQRKEHVEVTLFTSWMQADKIAWLRRFGCFVGACAFGLLAYSLALGAIRAYHTFDAYLGVNLILTWPARAAAAIGVSILVLRLVYEMFAGSRDEPAQAGDESTPTV